MNETLESFCINQHPTEDGIICDDTMEVCKYLGSDTSKCDMNPFNNKYSESIKITSQGEEQ